MKGLVLFSGGLDSILATELVLKQDIEVKGVNFSTVFGSPFLITGEVLNERPLP